MKMEVIWEKDNLPHRETVALWDEHPYYTPVNPGRVPTRIELETCPKVFTCFSCLEKYPQRELGGRYHEKWFCEYCIPYIDETPEETLRKTAEEDKAVDEGRAGNANPECGSLVRHKWLSD
jgi:hypothetical protein